MDIDPTDTRLATLLEQAAAGAEIVLSRDGEPVARLIAVQPQSEGMQKRPMGLLAGMGTVPDDFNDPLPDELLAAFEGR